jgi:trans-2,3-dihydro-3-hydroxyanthranilate isomerase
MNITVHVIKSFTKHAHQGNPAGVVLLREPLESSTMQMIAKVLGFSETAFLELYNVMKSCVSLRFFTPKQEIDACAHATIAAAHVIADNNVGIIKFKTNKGIVNVRRMKDGFIEIMMGNAVFSAPEQNRGHIAEVLGIKEEQLGKQDLFPCQITSVVTPKLIIPVNSFDTLMSITPNLNGIAEYCQQSGARGFYPFTFETQEERSDFHARQFNPLAGINEDAATGVAAGALVAYIRKHNLSIKTRFIVEQGLALNTFCKIYARVIKDSARVGGYAVKHSEREVAL